MAFREQISQPNPVGEWLRNYRQQHDMNVLELESVFQAIELIGIPVHRLETTDRPITRTISDPVIDYFDNDEELIKAFAKHNSQALEDKYQL